MTAARDEALAALQQLADQNMPELMVNPLAWAFFQTGLQIVDRLAPD